MNETIQNVREALASIPHGAIDALANNQRQLDMDGCEVGVSRQAVDEVLAGLRAAIAALDAETEVKVRELEWVEPSRQTNGCWTAPCIFGVYSVVNEGGWYAMLEGGPSGHCFEWYGHDMSKDTLATAKAAAQADYERRIRSALVPPESRS